MKPKSTFLLIITVFTALCLSACEQPRSLAAMPFDSETWRRHFDTADAETWRIRSAMARDLIEKKTLIGKNRDEMSALLGSVSAYEGAEDANVYDRNFQPKAALYALEPIMENGDANKTTAIEELKLTFGKDGKISDARIILFKVEQKK